MFPSNPIIRTLFLLFVVLIASWIFGLIIWRGGNALGFDLKWKTIGLLSLGLLGLFIAGMAIGNLAGRPFEIIGILIVWIVYTLWVISPLLIVRDIIAIWYKIPFLVMTIVSILWVLVGIYFGTTTKITPLHITSSHLSGTHKIVFISDIHVEAIHNTRYIQSIVNKIKVLQPDFVLLGGDLMNTAKSDYVDAFLPFNQLDIPVYATLGNHDNMWEAKAIAGIFDTTKIIPLRNQSVNISGIQIVGIDDKSYRSGQTLTEILDKSQIATGAQFTILISHQPQKLSKLAGYPIDLELAGHTHQGQFIPLSWLIGVFNDYAYGKYEESGKTAFVSQWIGTWWAPIRIGTQSELVLITLEHGK